MYIGYIGIWQSNMMEFTWFHQQNPTNTIFQWISLAGKNKTGINIVFKHVKCRMSWCINSQFRCLIWFCLNIWYIIYPKIHRIRIVYPVIMQCLKVRHHEMDHQWYSKTPHGMPHHLPRLIGFQTNNPNQEMLVALRMTWWSNKECYKVVPPSYKLVCWYCL